MIKLYTKITKVIYQYNNYKGKLKFDYMENDRFSFYELRMQFLETKWTPFPKLYHEVSHFS